MEEKYYIGYVFEEEDFEAALYCDAHQNCYIEEINPVNNKRRFQIMAFPEPSQEEVAEQNLIQAKSERSQAVSQITVEVDSMLFDGDEKSQERMARTITAATATGVSMDETTTWVLHDNTIAHPTIKQLATALRKAGEAQTILWTKPYES